MRIDRLMNIFYLSVFILVVVNDKRGVAILDLGVCIRD